MCWQFAKTDLVHITTHCIGLCTTYSSAPGHGTTSLMSKANQRQQGKHHTQAQYETIQHSVKAPLLTNPPLKPHWSDGLPPYPTQWAVGGSGNVFISRACHALVNRIRNGFSVFYAPSILFLSSPSPPPHLLTPFSMVPDDLPPLIESWDPAQGSCFLIRQFFPHHCHLSACSLWLLEHGLDLRNM